MIRAKFRCMSVTYNAERASDVRFLPVVPKCSAYPEGCDENRSFWDATPSGEMKIAIKQGVEVPYTVGDFYFIYMERLDEVNDVVGSWKMWEVSQHDTNINIQLGLRWSNERDMTSASLSMGIVNKTIWPAFIGRLGSKWHVRIEHAD